MADADDPKPPKKPHGNTGFKRTKAEREAISAGMELWHAGRSAEEVQATREKLADAARFYWSLGGHFVAGNDPGCCAPPRYPDTAEKARQTRMAKEFIVKIIREIVDSVEGKELVRDAIICGLASKAPYSFPYIKLAAAYLDGNPIDRLPPPEQKAIDLSLLTPAELVAAAQSLADRVRLAAEEQQGATQNAQSAVTVKRLEAASGLPVIDGQTVPEKE